MRASRLRRRAPFSWSSRDNRRATRRRGVQPQLESCESRALLTLNVTPVDTAAALVNALVVPNTGITVVGATLTGAADQQGTFSNLNFNDGTSSLTIDNGILLTSGSAVNALGPNNNSSATTDQGLPGDPDLEALNPGYTSYDANALTIHFTVAPGTQTIRFDFIFGSDEFPEWVHTPYNDAFGAFLDGVQVSHDLNGNINSVNNVFFTLNNNTGNDPTVPPLDNGGSPITGTTVVNFSGADGTQYDGLTPRLTTQATLNTGLTEHTLKLVIDDEGDHILDSGVFLARLRGDTTGGGGGGGGGGGETELSPTAVPGGPYTAAPGQTIQLDASGSINPNGPVDALSFAWDLDDNGTYETPGKIVPFSALLPGTYTVGLKVTDAFGNDDDATTTVQVSGVLPVVTSTVINDGSAQRSMVKSITVYFAQDVHLDPGAFRLAVPAGAQGVNLIVNPPINEVNDHYTITFVGTGYGLAGGSLEDGRYTLTIDHTKVHNDLGENMAADVTVDFWRLFGDLKGTGVVDSQDLYLFKQAYNSSIGSPNYLAAFDYNGDGKINLEDLNRIMLRRNKRV